MAGPGVIHLRFRHEDLREFCTECLARVGLTPDDGALVTDHLVTASLRGVDSHGVVRLPYYVEGIEAGYVSPRPAVRVVREAPPMALLDCGAGLGIIGAKRAEEIAYKKSLEQGVAVVGAYNIGHVGMLAYYTRSLASRGLIAIAMANGPAEVVPWGGVSKVFGTNPISYAIPRRNAAPIVADMATSAVAKFKIVLAAAAGSRLPEGAAIGRDGRTTTDPHEALEGALLPFGGYKGYAISLLVEVLAAALLGGTLSLEVKHHPSTQGGFLIIALNPRLMSAEDEFFTRLEKIIGFVKSSERAEGVDEILLPGEPEERTFLERLTRGIPIPEPTVKSLTTVGERMGVMFPQPVD